jgi:hypothetical protein
MGLQGRRLCLDATMKAVNAKQFDLVAAARLGPSLTHLLDLLQAQRDKGGDLFLH